MQPMNLSSQCLDSWAGNKVLDHDLARLMVVLRQELSKAPKFMLPAGGRPLDDPASIARTFTDLHLPYPCVALEYMADGPVGDAEVVSRRRISLVWAVENGCLPLFISQLAGPVTPVERGLLVQSISFVDHLDLWMPVLGMVLVDLAEPPRRMSIDELPQLQQDLTRHRWRERHSESYSATPLCTVPRFAREVGDEQAAHLIAADTSDEVLAALSFAALTMCGNVEQQVIPAPAALNKKRAARSKVPIDDTRVLVFAHGEGYVGVRPSEPRQAGIGSGHADRARPHEHLRRGHIRRYGSGEVKFIPFTIVNPGVGEAPQNAPRYELRGDEQRQRMRG